MNSRQALKEALKGADRHVVARAMEMQIGSLNNQVAGELPYYPKGKTLNFAERTMRFMEAVEAETGKHGLLQWMAEEMGCIVIKNPAVSAANSPAISKISKILQDFSSVVDEIGKATEDLRIEQHEAESIRSKWEVMKRTCEEFVLACETGVYDNKK